MRLWEEFDVEEAKYWDRFLRERGRDAYMDARYFSKVNDDEQGGGEDEARGQTARRELVRV